MTKIISVKQIMDAVEKTVNDCSKEELGDILREMARKVPKEKRAYFLDQLHPYIKGEQPRVGDTFDGALLDEIDEFIETLEVEMENRDESVYEDGYGTIYMIYTYSISG